MKGNSGHLVQLDNPNQSIALIQNAVAIFPEHIHQRVAVEGLTVIVGSSVEKAPKVLHGAHLNSDWRNGRKDSTQVLSPVNEGRMERRRVGVAAPLQNPP